MNDFTLYDVVADWIYFTYLGQTSFSTDNFIMYVKGNYDEIPIRNFDENDKLYDLLTSYVHDMEKFESIEVEDIKNFCEIIEKIQGRI